MTENSPLFHAWQAVPGIERPVVKGHFRPNEHLKRERLLRGWTQADLAGFLETDGYTVNRWERGRSRPGPYFRRQLCEIFGKNALELGFLSSDVECAGTASSPSVDLLPPLWSLSQPRNPYFTGREEILHLLHTRLAAAQSVALSGLGGIGKTQVAIEYAYRYASEYRAIFWIEAETALSQMTSLQQIADLLQLFEGQVVTHAQIEAAMRRWFITHSDWLLIVDNVEDLELLPVLPFSQSGSLLLTTRRQSLGVLAEPLALPPMDSEEGTELLLRRTRQLAVPVSSNPWEHKRLPGGCINSATVELVRALEGLPLALDQVGAYLEETECSIADYLQQYHKQRKQILAHRGIHGGAHPNSVATTLRLSVERVFREDPVAVDLLRVCAFLYPEGIPEEMFARGASFLGPVLGPVVVDPYQFDMAVAALRNASLVKRDPETRTISVHRLVQAVLQDQMEPAEALLWGERVTHLVNAAFPEGAAFENWQRCGRLLPHVQTCYELSKQYYIQTPEAARLFLEAGAYLRERGRFAEAEQLLRSALALREQIYGPEHASVAMTRHLLARLFLDQRHFAQSEPLFLQVLAFWETQADAEPLEIARCLGDLAGLYDIWGKHEQVEVLFQRALAICEPQLGATHPYTLECLNDLAAFYSARGNYARAVPMFLRAMTLWEEHISTDDRMVNIIRHNLAVIYGQQKNYTEAEALYLRALAFRERHLEPGHPETTGTQTALAALYREQKEYWRAEVLYLKVIAIHEQLLEMDEPKMVPCLHGLGRVYLALGKYEQAAPLLQRALENSRRHFGANHPKTASCLSSLGWLALEQGQNVSAETLLQQALSIFQQYLDPAHSEVMLCQSILARLSAQQRKTS